MHTNSLWNEGYGAQANTENLDCLISTVDAVHVILTSWCFVLVLTRFTYQSETERNIQPLLEPKENLYFALLLPFSLQYQTEILSLHVVSPHKQTRQKLTNDNFCKPLLSLTYNLIICVISCF